MSQPPLILVDGSSYLFRAYHALPPLTNKAGHPTGAMYGVLNMLKKLVLDVPTDAVAVVFDTKGKTFRHERYPEYKANRPEMPEELAAQIAPLHQMIQDMGFPLIAVPGVEADDVIATLAKHAADSRRPVLISTGDKDLTQLVTEQVTWSNSMTGETLDPAGVEAKFGVPPERIPDYLALIGDSVDNVPGIPKVGPKTAVKWLSQYGTLDKIVRYADDIKGKVGENLRNHLDQLALSRELVEVKRDVELPMDIQDCVRKPKAVEALRKAFAEYEFTQWLKQLDEGEAPIATATTTTYESVTTKAALKAWCERVQSAGLVAVDTETTSLDYLSAELVGISLAVSEDVAAYIPVGHTGEGAEQQLSKAEVLAALKPWLIDANRQKIGHHLKYDAHVFENEGIHLAGIAYDTMLESYLKDATKTRHDLASVAKTYLARDTVSYEDVVGKGAQQVGFDTIGLEQATEYAAEDAEITWRLHQALWPQLSSEQQALFETLEKPLISVLWSMERRGVCLDSDLLRAQSMDLATRLSALEEEIACMAGESFNISSPKQLQAILYDKLGLPILQKTPTGQPSTAESVLQELAHEFELPDKILAYRSLSKLKSTYTDKLPELVHPATQRLHTSYHQATVATGRLSSSDPNLQNIPIRTEDGRKIRQAFVASPGYTMVAADYSQIELRIMAHLSGDPSLCEAFQRNDDIHRFTASEIFGVDPQAVDSEQRRRAKAINFGLIYGMSAFGLAKQLDIPRDDAQAYMDHYFERYPKVKAYMAATREQAATQGYVETLLGRRLYLPEIRSRNLGRRRQSERAAINAPMQGTAADIVKQAMISVAEYADQAGDAVYLLLQVHDELVLEVRNDALSRVIPEIKALMEAPCAERLAVPLVVDVGQGPHWEAAH